MLLFRHFQSITTIMVALKINQEQILSIFKKLIRRKLFHQTEQ